jgi:CarD family transcriptional regulator
MLYKIGDTIIHWTFGIGKIIAVEEKQLSGLMQQYYVIDIERFTLWVPFKEENNGSIRFLTESIQFKALFDILRRHGNRLPEQYDKRRSELKQRMLKSSLGDICHVIRDLTDRSRLHTLNQNDSSVLNSAKTQLLDEWVLSLEAERPDAVRELEILLQEDS